MKGARAFRTRVKSVSSSNTDVCEVVRLSPHEVIIVGKRPGIAQIALRYEGKSVPDTYSVAVRSPGPKNNQLDRQHGKLKRLLQNLYPQVGLQLTWQQHQLIVTGEAKSKREAIEIVSMVRRLMLVPVVDRVVVED